MAETPGSFGPIAHCAVGPYFIQTFVDDGRNLKPLIQPRWHGLMNGSESVTKLGEITHLPIHRAYRRAQPAGAHEDGNREVEGELYDVAQLSVDSAPLDWDTRSCQS